MQEGSEVLRDIVRKQVDTGKRGGEMSKPGEKHECVRERRCWRREGDAHKNSLKRGSKGDKCEVSVLIGESEERQ